METEPVSLEGQVVNVGDQVRVITEMSAYRVNTNNTILLDPATELQVTRVYRHNLIVRTVEEVSIRSPYSGTEMRRASFSISREQLMAADPNAPRRRRLGEKPEDTDEMTYVSVDDPGIQWLFDDMGKHATDQGYCPQYDMLCARLGIPGREREYTVKTELNGLTVSATVMARSQREARQKIDAALSANNTTSLPVAA